ncbi:MAG: hypothetical protein RJA81_774 [Planctomycetota bacterium]
MDLFCCGMYRSCSTWQYEVALEVLKHAKFQGSAVKVQPLGYRTGPEYASLEKSRGFRGLVRVFKGHEGHPSYTKAMFRGKGFGLYAHRDIRDVIFSLMHKRKQNFREIIQTGMIHQILVNDRFWRLHPQVMVQRYDDILNHPQNAILEIAEFLHVELPTGEADRIAGIYSKEANLKRTRELKDQLAEQGIDLNDSGNAQVYDPSTLLHWNHIRPDSRGWKQSATATQRMVLQKLLGPWLLENGYPEDDFSDLNTQKRELKSWRIDAAQGLLRCHSREISSRYHRLSQPIKRILGLGRAERNSRSVESLSE